MNGRMTNRALCLAHRRLIVSARNLRRELFRYARMAFEAELSNLRTLEHPWVGGSVRNVARGAALKLQRTVFENERSLLVGVALDAGCIDADCELRLLGLEAA